MINVKLFGLLRLDTGIKELQVKAGTVRELFPALLAELQQSAPDCGVNMPYLKGCTVTLNDRPASLSDRLQDGDRVCLTSPMAGG